MQDLPHAVQRDVKHIVVFQIPPHVGHYKGGLLVLTFRVGGCRSLRGGGSFRLRLHRGQRFQLPLRFDLPDGPADGGFQLVRVHRLQQIIAGPQMHRLVGVLEQAVGRDEDDPAAGPLGQHSAGSIQTAHTRHLNVHQNEVRSP